jgi:hypothetical protein
MITEDLLVTDQSYPSVYLQLDLTLAAIDEPEADVIGEMLRKYSVHHKRNECTFHIHAQKVTLDGESLIAFLAIFHDIEVEVSPKIRLRHSGDRRFDIDRDVTPAT